VATTAAAATQPAQTVKTVKTPPAKRKGQTVAWLFLAPYLALFGVFVLLPIVFGLWISLHSWDFTLPGKPFVGLENYTNLLDPDSVSFDAFWGAKIMIRFTREQLGAIVEQAGYTDPRAAQYMLDALVERQRKTAR